MPQAADGPVLYCTVSMPRNPHMKYCTATKPSQSKGYRIEQKECIRCTWRSRKNEASKRTWQGGKCRWWMNRRRWRKEKTNRQRTKSIHAIWNYITWILIGEWHTAPFVHHNASMNSQKVLHILSMISLRPLETAQYCPPSNNLGVNIRCHRTHVKISFWRPFNNPTCFSFNWPFHNSTPC